MSAANATMPTFATTVRETSPDRYFAALFAPEARRADLMTLYALDVELASVRDKVSEPMLGEVRLQWWRDTLETGQDTGNPLADAVLGLAARRDLPIPALVDLADARVFDLYDDPFPTLNDLEGHAGETAGRVAMLAAAILAPDMPRTGASADAAGHGGVALLLRDAVLTAQASAARGQAYLPADMLLRHETNVPDIASDGLPDALRAELIEVAGAHFSAAQLAVAALPAAARPAFLPLATVPLDLTKGKTAPLWRRLWSLRNAARRGV